MKKLINTVWKVSYTNWRGEKNNRIISIKDVYVGSTKYHHQQQLLLQVYDREKRVLRDFAVKDIDAWIKRLA